MSQRSIPGICESRAYRVSACRGLLIWFPFSAVPQQIGRVRELPTTWMLDWEYQSGAATVEVQESVILRFGMSQGGGTAEAARLHGGSQATQSSWGAHERVVRR